MTKWWKFYKASFSGLKKEIWILALITLINRAGSMVIPFLSLYLTQDKGFDLTTAGLILSSYGVGSIGGNYLGGVLTDMLGSFKVQVFSLISTALCFMLLSKTNGMIAIMARIALTAICADAFRPASMSAVGEHSKNENRSRAIGLIRLAINIGFTLGPAVAGWLAYTYSYGHLFWVDAVTCLLESDIGTLLGFNGLVIVLLEMPLLHALRKQEKVMRWIAKGVFAVGISYSFLLLTESYLLFYVMMLILTIGEMLSFPLSTTWTLNRSEESNRGKYLGIYGVAFSISHIVGPTTGLYIANSYGWDLLWIVLSGVAILNAFFLTYVVRG